MTAHLYVQRINRSIIPHNLSSARLVTSWFLTHGHYHTGASEGKRHISVMYIILQTCYKPSSGAAENVTVAPFVSLNAHLPPLHISL